MYKHLYIILFFLIVYNPAYSQEEDTTVYQTDEVIISATRTEQKVIDIPFSVQRVDKTEWKSSRKMGMNDVLTNIPGLMLQP
ncbi:MAG: hypothetical protein WAU38_12290, partial [Ignavibacteria bacterium]